MMLWLKLFVRLVTASSVRKPVGVDVTGRKGVNITLNVVFSAAFTLFVADSFC